VVNVATSIMTVGALENSNDHGCFCLRHVCRAKFNDQFIVQQDMSRLARSLTKAKSGNLNKDLLVLPCL
jgi:hypothetical protein